MGTLTEFEKASLMSFTSNPLKEKNLPNVGEEEIEVINLMYLFHEASYIL